MDPREVWHLVERADELLKYAQNRDPEAAYTQALASLAAAEEAAASLDEPAATSIADQVSRRRADIARLRAGEANA